MAREAEAWVHGRERGRKRRHGHGHGHEQGHENTRGSTREHQHKAWSRSIVCGLVFYMPW